MTGARVEYDPARATAEQLAMEQDRIASAVKRYEQTGNPAFAWDAIAVALTYRQLLPLPAPVHQYLLRVAVEIAALSRSRVPVKGGIARAVSHALGFTARGRANAFREMRAVSHEIMLAFEVYSYWTTHDNYAWTAIYQDVAAAHPQTCDSCKTSVSVATVRRAWRKYASAIVPATVKARYAHVFKKSLTY